MNQCDNEVKAKAVDTLLNFETVKYYGAEDYESNRFFVRAICLVV
jgi:ATP-binding cassette subfamily B (MDR/TAP) protein 6